MKLRILDGLASDGKPFQSIKRGLKKLAQTILCGFTLLYSMVSWSADASRLTTTLPDALQTHNSLGDIFIAWNGPVKYSPGNTLDISSYSQNPGSTALSGENTSSVSRDNVTSHTLPAFETSANTSNLILSYKLQAALWLNGEHEYDIAFTQGSNELGRDYLTVKATSDRIVADQVITMPTLASVNRLQVSS